MRTSQAYRMIVTAVGAVLFAGSVAFAQTVTVTVTGPPDRNGSDPGDGDNTSCPPGPDTATKGDPDAARDENVAGNSDKDFFMGEWVFVKGNQDLKVQKWCINEPENNGHLGDYFTYRIITSEGHDETVAIPAGDEPI